MFSLAVASVTVPVLEMLVAVVALPDRAPEKVVVVRLLLLGLKVRLVEASAVWLLPTSVTKTG